MQRSCLYIVLAAGEGTRMNSTKPKVLQEIANLPMICHVLSAAKAIGNDKIIVVLGDKAQEIQHEITKFYGELLHVININYVVQHLRLGTAHAALAAKAELSKGYDDVIICFGDTPLLQAHDFQALRDSLSRGYDLAVAGFYAKDPFGYGRLIMDGDKLQAIIEEKELKSEQKDIKFCNGGVMAIRGNILLDLLNQVGNRNSTGEYYLTDIVDIAYRESLRVTAIELEEESLRGANTLLQLNEIDKIWQKRKYLDLLQKGVYIQQAETIYFSYDTIIEAGTRLESNIYFGPGCSVGKNAHIRAFSYLEGVRIDENVVVGPFARLREGTILEKGSKIGNFCELKQAHIEKNSKINHLSYVGDARVGRGVNIGAGVVTCNYDGVQKHKTYIGDGVFVGSNSSLVAPIYLHDNCYIASGSIITKDVPAKALALGRARQINKEEYVIKAKEKE